MMTNTTATVNLRSVNQLLMSKPYSCTTQTYYTFPRSFLELILASLTDRRGDATKLLSVAEQESTLFPLSDSFALIFLSCPPESEYFSLRRRSLGDVGALVEDSRGEIGRRLTAERDFVGRVA